MTDARPSFLLLWGSVARALRGGPRGSLRAIALGTLAMIGAGALAAPASGAGPEASLGDTRLEARLETKAVEGGVDFVIELRNTGDRPEAMPALRLRGLGLAGRVWWSDWQHEGARRAVLGGPAHFGYPHGPKGHYAPVAMFGDGERSVGVSYLYNALEDRHDVRGSLERDGEGWVFTLRFASGGAGEHERVRYAGRIAPGESRRRTVAVRYGDPGASARELVGPYAEYYAGAHGPVAYERDARPVRGLAVARVGLTSEENPYGFEEPERPDLHGFGRWNRRLREVATRWERVMLWAPTGVYRENKKLNYPFRFTTFWLDGDRYGHAMGDAPARLSEAARGTGIELGLWWGRSCQIMEGWDREETTPLRPSRAADRERAFAELDLAVQAGATMIGLDAFPGSGGLAVWDAEPWLRELWARHPGVRFVTEKQKPDVLHRLAPTYFFAYDHEGGAARSAEAASFLTRRHALADLLNPGHESWAGMNFTLLKTRLGRDLETYDRQKELIRMMELGYTPVVLGGDFDPGALAEGLSRDSR